MLDCRYLYWVAFYFDIECRVAILSEMKPLSVLPTSSTELFNEIDSDSDKWVWYVNQSTGQRIDVRRDNRMTLKCYVIYCLFDSEYKELIDGLDSREVFDCFIDICTSDRVYQYGERYTLS
jgi:hypothetical protein